jgi:CheY-like chemotaxis protein
MKQMTSEHTASPKSKLIVLNRDLFFGVKIGNGLRSLGYEVQFAKSVRELAEAIRMSSPPFALAVIDMGLSPDWDVIAELTADPAITTPFLGFGSHLDVEGRKAAKAAGVNRIVSNGDFHRDMVTLVERYALKSNGS